MDKNASGASDWPAHFQPAVVATGFGGGKLSSFCLALEAWRRGLEVSFCGRDGTQVTITDGTTSVSFNHSRSDRITDEAHDIVESKYKTASTLRQAGVPAPQSHYFDIRESSFTDILQAACALSFPVVLKPVQGSVGRGVLANIHSAEQLEAGYRHLVDDLHIKRIVLERHHQGNDYRVFVSNGQYMAAVLRLPAHVTGDGRSTVHELIEQKNQLRRQNPFLSGGLITVDYEVNDMLSRAGHTWQSVPAQGAHVALRAKANASAGGDVVDVTETLPERIQQAAATAVEAIPGLPAAGVDVLWDEHNTAECETDFVIIEMNARSHIGVNMYPTHGTGRDLPQRIIDGYFPQSLRPQSEHFASITFDRREAISPLLAGIASKVTIAPLPDHGFPIRRLYSLSSHAHLSAQGHRVIDKLTRKLKAACQVVTADVATEGQQPWGMIAAENEASLRRLHHALARQLGEHPRRIASWKHPVYVGFKHGSRL